MKNRSAFAGLLLLLLVMLMVVFGLAGCGAERPDNSLKEISRCLGADVSSGKIVSQSDSHGGFHGDGTTVVEIRFTDTAFAEQIVAEQIEEKAEWDALPLTDNLTALVYGLHTDHSSIGPIIHEGDGIPVIPVIEKGYYYFLDRHSRSTNPRGDAEVLDRGSYNFTIAILDTETNTLYYLELDT